MGEDGDEGSACDSTVSEEISDRGQGGVEEGGAQRLKPLLKRSKSGTSLATQNKSKSICYTKRRTQVAWCYLRDFSRNVPQPP